MHKPDTAEGEIILEPALPHQDQSGVPPTSYTDRFARGAFWNLVGTVGARLSTFVGAVITARFLGQVGFGELGMIQTSIGLLGTFAALGLGMTATRYVAELRLKDPERTGRIIALTYIVSWSAGGLMALICFSAAPWLAARTLNAPHLAPELRLASTLLLVSAGFGPQTSILSGMQAFRTVARINWWQSLGSLPFTVILVWLAGLRGIILALILSVLIGAVLCRHSLSQEYRANGIRLNYLQAWKEKAILWQFSLPAFLTSVLYAPFGWAAQAFLAHQTNGYAELGLFNAAMQFNILITGLSVILASVSVPMLAEIHGHNQQERFALAINMNLRLNWGLAILFGFVVLIISPWLIQFFGTSFQGALPTLRFTICFSVINVACAIAGQTFYSSGKMWFGPFIVLFWGVILLTFEMIVVPRYGAMGLSISFLIADCLVFLLQFLLLIKVFGSIIIKDVLVFYVLNLILVCSAFIFSKYNNLEWNLIYLILFILTAFLLYMKNKDLLLKIFSSIQSFKAGRGGYVGNKQ